MAEGSVSGKRLVSVIRVALKADLLTVGGV
jgi:hypothetical protein